MAQKFYIVYFNDDKQHIERSDDSVTIKGDRLRLLEAKYLQEEEIEEKNAYYVNHYGFKNTIKDNLKNTLFAFGDASPYIAITLYFFLFFLIDLVPDSNLFVNVFLKNFMLLYSLGTSFSDVLFFIFRKHSFYRKGLIYIFVFAISLFVPFLFDNEILLNEMRFNIILMLLTYLLQSINIVRTRYSYYSSKTK